MNTALIFADLAVSSGGLGQGLILLVVGIIVLAFLWWVVQSYVPEPMKRYAVLVIVLLCVIVLVNFVLSLGGLSFIRR